MQSVELNLKGKAYKMVFDGNALAAYEDATGRNLMTESIGEQVSVKTVTALVWSSLNTNHPELTLREFRALVTHDELPNVLRAFAKAWGMALPEPKAEDAGNPTSGPQGTASL